MKLSDHKLKAKTRSGININWPEGSDEEFIRFERFVVENSINRASFIRALIKDYLDGVDKIRRGGERA